MVDAFWTYRGKCADTSRMLTRTKLMFIVFASISEANRANATIAQRREYFDKLRIKRS